MATAFRYRGQDAIPRIGFTSCDSSCPSSSYAQPQGGDPSSPLPLSSSESSSCDTKNDKLPFVVNTSLPLTWTKPYTRTPGFNNLGNTCYMNSILQALLHVPPFAHLLDQEAKRLNGRKGGGFCGLTGLAWLRKEVVSCRGNTIAPRYFVNNLKSICSLFKTYKMEDAAEFSNNLLASCSRSYILGCSKSSSKYSNIALTQKQESSTPIHQVFGGLLNSTVVCSKCGYQSIREEYFRELHCEIDRCRSVHAALSNFTKPEYLSGSNKYHCQRCNRKVDASKRYSIRQAPNVLTIILKRFQGRNRKNTAHIQCPEILDISKYLGAGANQKVTYSLSALVVHEGSSTNSGHYYAVVRSPDGSWTTKDDSHQRNIRLDQVLAKKAYVLFYTRNPSTEKDLVSATSRRQPAAKPFSHEDALKAVSEKLRVPLPLPKLPITPTPAVGKRKRNEILVVGRGKARRRTEAIFRTKEHVPPPRSLEQPTPVPSRAPTPTPSRPPTLPRPKIGTWDTSERSIFDVQRPRATTQKRKRAGDELDSEYDAGRMKKVRENGRDKKAFSKFVNGSRNSRPWSR